MKSLVGIFSLVVGVGVIGAPIAAYSGQNSQRIRRSTNSDGSRGGSSSGGVTIYTTSQQTETFEGMWQKIEAGYNNKNNSQSNLPGKSNLKSIINSQTSTSKDWLLRSSNGRSCQKPTDTMETFCGFLHLMKTDDTEYKLKVAVDNEGKGKIKIVKKFSQEVEYYDSFFLDNSPPSGRDSIIHVNFDELSDFEKDINDLWKNYQDAIIFSQTL